MSLAAVIDTHCHWVSPGMVEFLNSPEGRTALAPGRGAALGELMPESWLRAYERMMSLDTILEQIDDAGVDLAVLSPPPPGATFGDPDLMIRTAQLLNDEYLAAAEKRPDRFSMMLSLPLPDVEASLAELDRSAGHPCAQGIVVLTTSQGFTIDLAALEPVYRRAAELNLPVQTHPPAEVLAPAWKDMVLEASLAPVVSTSLGVSRLVLSGMLDRVPDLDVIVPHLGGTLPYLAGRVVDFGNGAAEHDLRHYLATRLYYDSCSFHAPALRCAIDTVGADRIVLGSDFAARGPISRAVEFVRANLSGSECAAVLGGTAARWFKAQS